MEFKSELPPLAPFKLPLSALSSMSSLSSTALFPTYSTYPTTFPTFSSLPLFSSSSTSSHYYAVSFSNLPLSNISTNFTSSPFMSNPDTSTPYDTSSDTKKIIKQSSRQSLRKMYPRSRKMYEGVINNYRYGLRFFNKFVNLLIDKKNKIISIDTKNSATKIYNCLHIKQSGYIFASMCKKERDFLIKTTQSNKGRIEYAIIIARQIYFYMTHEDIETMWSKKISDKIKESKFIESVFDEMTDDELLILIKWSQSHLDRYFTDFSRLFSRDISSQNYHLKE